MVSKHKALPGLALLPGSLSLWGFATSSDLLGFSLPTTFMNLDHGACGDGSPLRAEDMCEKLHAIRGLVRWLKFDIRCVDVCSENEVDGRRQYVALGGWLIYVDLGFRYNTEAHTHRHERRCFTCWTCI